ncbi:sensor histidine kinase [Nocardia sp. NPDC050406]|uniref:sensor histidine kinase n=1 Tax=Nocardia sp. NPDC050406 TaxID=3364318 RepID=UPI0037B5D75D
MSWSESQKWTTVGRWALVLALTLTAVQNGASTNAGQYLTAATAVAVLSGFLLVFPRAHWLLAPAVTTVGAGLWGWVMLPLLLLALFDLAARRRIAAAVVCAALAQIINLWIHPTMSLWTPQQYGSSLFLVLAVVCGMWAGNRRRLVGALNAQVEHLRIERELREQAARATERSAIAAEMHDVLAHRLSLIALHTGVLATKKDTLPEPIAERLALLRTAATGALSDLRDVLGALHEPKTDTTAAPAPVLRDVQELIEQARATGQVIDAAIAGDPDRAPATHRLAVFRLVQEALTNARKHATGAPVSVRVDYGPPATLVEVVNAPGTSAATVSSGFGLIGLRERVAALGGELEVGPGGNGTWSLSARIPHPASTEQDGAHP